MVQWYHGSEVLVPFPQPLKLICQQRYLNLRYVTHVTTSCYWCDMLQDLGYPSRSSKTLFFFFRFSFRGTSDLSPFPFSATTQVMENNVFTRRKHTGQLYLVCKNCWIHLRHVSTLCEPCRGCEFFESIGWELWTPGRGRSAWWRHPCWMIIFYIFSNQDVNFFS